MGRRPSERWQMVRDVCDANPGRWVLVSREGHAAWQQQVKHGRLRAFQPPGMYEAMMREGNGVIGHIFVRRVPDEEEARATDQDNPGAGPSQGVQQGAPTAS